LVEIFTVNPFLAGTIVTSSTTGESIFFFFGIDFTLFHMVEVVYKGYGFYEMQ
jgi:hypothetical protein